jgi:hypothetical protein
MNIGNKIGKTLRSDHPQAGIRFKIKHPWKEELYESFSLADNRFELLKQELGDKMELFVSLMTDDDKTIDEELIQTYEPYEFD